MTALYVIKRKKHVVASTERPVYFDSKLIGLYVRIGVRRYAAFDEHGVWLGAYKRSSRAQRAIRSMPQLVIVGADRSPGSTG